MHHFRDVQRDQFVTIRSAQTLTELHGPSSRDCERACKHAALLEIGKPREGLKIRRASALGGSTPPPGTSLTSCDESV